MTLNDYCNERTNVVLFCVGIGTPGGEYHALGYPDLDFPDRNGILDLTGTVDEAGDWRWDGEGKPTDDYSNSIYKLHAYVDNSRWERIVEEYESAA